MNTKVTVKTKIVVDGKEYHSPEELPAALRAAYEKAVASGAQARPTSRIVFRGSQRILRGLLIGAALLALLYWMYGR